MLLLSLKERDRLVALRQLHAGARGVSETARELGLTPRHVRRLLRRFEREGDRVVVHAARGRPSNHRRPEGIRERALERARDPLFRDFGPTLLAEHLSRDLEIGPLNPHTLRRWLIEAGLWSRKRRRPQHRRRRERRAACGELVQMDTSIHPWLEGRSSEEVVLVALIDDASSRLFARFFPRDTGAANRQLLIDYLQRFGRMRAVYADRAGHFQGNWRTTERRLRDQEPALTVIRRGLTALGIELIPARSPQAKGRIERLFGTLQDRLLKEMRLAGIDSMAEANRYLEEVFIPRCWEPRFTHTPRNSRDAHRRLPRGTDLQRLFAEEDSRVLQNDFTFRYRSQLYQVERADARGLKPKDPITAERRPDGTLRFRAGQRYLEPTPIDARPQRNRAPTRPASKRPKPMPPKPGPDHPWRKNPIRVGRGRFLPPRTEASAPAALRPDSPAGVNSC